MNSAGILRENLASYSVLIDREMRDLLAEFHAPAAYYGMMRYHLGWVDERLQDRPAPRGKGLRGGLLMLMNAALGGDSRAATPLAVGFELLHNFSLVHDDIEDNSATRRHRPTAWSIWGVPLSINMGDGMYALAHVALFRSPLARTSAEIFVDIVHQFDLAALHLSEGQHLDMSFERAAYVDVDDYLQMVAGKSATLIATASWAGARAASATPAQAQAARRFGHALGMAFQMQDDILGIWGDEAMTGKSASSDIDSRKKTLPVLLALAHADSADRERLADLYASGSDDSAVGTGPDPGDASAITALLDRAGAHDLSRECLNRYTAEALAALHEVGLDEQQYEQLAAFTRLFVDRRA